MNSEFLKARIEHLQPKLREEYLALVQNPPQLPLTFDRDLVSFKENIETIIKRVKRTDEKVQQLLGMQSSVDNFEDIILPTSWMMSEVMNLNQQCDWRIRVSRDQDERKLIGDLQAQMAGEYGQAEGKFLGPMLDVAHNLTVEPKSEDSQYIKILKSIRSSLRQANETALDKAKAEVKRLGESFLSSLGKDPGYILVTKAELNGLSDEFINGLIEESKGDKVYLRLTQIQSRIVLHNAKASETRRKAWNHCKNSNTDNVKIYKRILDHHMEIAHLSGDKTYAHSMLKDTAMKSPENVLEFLRNIKQELLPDAKEEINAMLEQKRKDENDPATEFYPWDFDFYHFALADRITTVDRNTIASYFLVQDTFRRLLDVFEMIFGLVFIDITGVGECSPTKSSSDLVWHEDVRVFSVWKESGDDKFVGYLYFDLLSRPGKTDTIPYHRCIRRGYRETGPVARSYTVSVVVANYVKGETHTFLQHPQIVHLFHETGHAIHSLASNTKYWHHHSSNVSEEFKETPSQLLEHFIWQPKVLEKVGRHYQTEQPLDFEMAKKIVEYANVNKATRSWSEIGSSEFHVMVYTNNVNKTVDEVDLENLWNQCLYGELYRIPEPQGENGKNRDNFYASALQTVRYGSTSYTYLFGRVISHDLFTRFNDDPLNRTVGMDWRREVLEPGTTKEPMEMMKAFLSRPPSVGAYFKALMKTPPDDDAIKRMDALFTESAKYLSASG